MTKMSYWKTNLKDRIYRKATLFNNKKDSYYEYTPFTLLF
jgi:hypothetical protein